MVYMSCSSLRRELPIQLAVLLYYTGENMIIMTALPLITYGLPTMVYMSCSSLRRELPIQLAVLLYYTGENMIIMTALPLITYGVCRDVFPNATTDFCLNINEHPEEERDVQKDSALYLMAEKMFGTVPPLLLSAFFGPWSDVHGRKLPLLLPFLGNMVSVGLFLLADHLQSTPVILLVMGGFLARALTGHYILVHLISFSYVADLVWAGGSMYQEIGQDDSPGRGLRSKRTQGRGSGRAGGPVMCPVDQGEFLASMSRLQVAESMGIVFGAGAGWALQKVGGPPLAFGVALGILLLGMAVILFWMHNFPRPAACQQLEAGPGEGDSTLRRLFRFFSCRKLDLDPVLLWGCFLIMFFMFACKEARSAVTVVFVQLPPLSWPNERFSAYICVYSVFQSVFLFLVAPALKDRTVVVVGLVSSVVGGLWLAFSTTTWSFMVAGCFSHMADCIFPALRAILSRQLSQDQVGQVLARLSTAEALSTLAGPPAITALYNATVDYFPGTAFLVSAAIPTAVLVVGVVVEVCHHPRKTRGRAVEAADLQPRDASHRPDFSQSLNIPSASVSGYGFMWCSAQW